MNLMVNASELTFNEQIELSKLKYGSNYLVTTTIPVVVDEKIKLSPDVAIFSVRLFVQDKDAKEAFNHNAQLMTEFRNFLTELNVADGDLNTLSYRNGESWLDQPVITKEKEQYRSVLHVSVKFDTKQFFDVVSLLEKYHINLSHFEGSSNNYYSFTIEEISVSADLAKANVRETFVIIQKKLDEMGIKTIDISNYINETIQPAVKTEKIKQYYVDNQLRIKLYDFAKIGKVLAKAQSLGFIFNNDISYSVSEKYKEKITQQYQSEMLKKMLNQANIFLGNDHNSYILGNLISFYPSVNTMQPLSEPLVRMDEMRMEKSMMTIDESKIIQAPGELEITLSMSGVFEVLAQVYQP